MEDQQLSEPLIERGNNTKRQTGCCPLSCRSVLAGLAFLGFVNVYALRVNLSVALVAMVKNSESDNSSVSDECPGDNSTDHNNSTQTGEFDWDSTQQGLILGSFFYGYIITQIPGGYFGERIGGKRLFGYGVLCTAVLTLITPLAARLHIYVLVAVRILEGFGEGVTFPAMHALLAKWAPKYERSKLGTFIYAGAQFGTVISMPISGLLCEHVSWDSVFYIFGSLGVVWFFVWMLLAADSPAQHKRISEEERTYIEANIGHSDEEHLPMPWRNIFSSIHVWAIIVAHFCNNWGFYTLLTCLPKYMKDILHFDISQNGFLSALPYLVMWIIINLGGQMADFLRTRNILSTGPVRKLFNTVGLILPGIFLVAAGYQGCNTVFAVALVTMAVGSAGLALSGFQVNHLDLAPPFAGTLLGITNCAATIPGFLGPLVVGYLTKESTREAWRNVFFISSGIYAFGAIFFAIFASGVEQAWAKPEFFEERRRKQAREAGLLTSDDDMLSS